MSGGTFAALPVVVDAQPIEEVAHIVQCGARTVMVRLAGMTNRAPVTKDILCRANPKRGDYLITHTNGDQEIQPKEIFEARYTALSTTT